MLFMQGGKECSLEGKSNPVRNINTTVTFFKLNQTILASIFKLQTLLNQ